MTDLTYKLYNQAKTVSLRDLLRLVAGTQMITLRKANIANELIFEGTQTEFIYSEKADAYLNDEVDFVAAFTYGSDIMISVLHVDEDENND